MSNLLKQYYVVQQENKKCIINSNSLAQERIRQFAVEAQTSGRQNGQALADGGFMGGIAAERIEVEPEPDPQEVAQQILADARAQAEQIIDEANVQAKLAIDETTEQAKILFDEQRELGYTEGAKAREMELAEFERSLSEQRTQLLEETRQKQSELESEFQMRMEEMEADIVDALLPVFEKVFHIQFSDKREILLGLIQNVLDNVEAGNKIRIRTNAADRQMLMEHLDEIKGQLGAEVSVELLQDVKLSDGQCQIETNYGVYDCGIDTQLDNLMKDIRSLV